MPKTLQHRRDSTANLAAVTGAAGEIFYDTTKDTLVVMDGSTPGGYPLEKEGAGTGATGAAGATGVAGASGAGTNGASGATGAAGSNGTNGATGAAGSNGTNGATGANGTNGATGIGASGATGIRGASGVQGASGAAGSNGTNGATGAQGASGVGGGGGGSYTSLTEDGGALTLTVDPTYELEATKATIGELYVQDNIITPLQVDSGDAYNTLIDQPVYINGNLTVAKNITFGDTANIQSKSYLRSDGNSNILIGGGNLNSGVSNVAADGTGSIRIGRGNAAWTLTQSNYSIAIGDVAGGAMNSNQTQSSYSIAIGSGTETWDGATRSIAIGSNAKAVLEDSISIGTQASASPNSIAIGNNAKVNLNNESTSRGIAIGPNARTLQGITISSNGNQITGGSGTIVLHANTSSGNYTTPIDNAFYVDPVRAVTSNAGLKQMYYNATSKEIVYYNV